MGIHAYGLDDFEAIAAGAAVLASGGGGSYHDARAVLQELEQRGWGGTVQVRAAEKLCGTPGVMASFAALLRQLGYAGALPSA